MHIRTVTEADAPALRRYVIELLAERLPGLFRREDPTLEQEVVFIRERIEPKNSTLLLAEVDGQIAGLAEFLGGGMEQTAHGGELGISVARAFRGRGIGTQLIEALLAWAPSAGVRRVEARGFSCNPRALELYRRLGFQDEGRLRDAVSVDGRLVDVVILARLLVA